MASIINRIDLLTNLNLFSCQFIFHEQSTNYYNSHPQTYLDIFLNLFYYQTNLIHTLWIKSNKLPITNLEKNNHNKEQNQTKPTNK